MMGGRTYREPPDLGRTDLARSLVERDVPALNGLLGDPDARGNAQDAWDDIAVFTREHRASTRSSPS